MEAENRALKKGFVEFFLAVANRVAQSLHLPLTVATHKVGELVAAAEEVEGLRACPADMVSWKICSEQIESSDELLLPVCGGDGREWLLAVVGVVETQNTDDDFGELARAKPARRSPPDHTAYPMQVFERAP